MVGVNNDYLKMFRNSLLLESEKPSSIISLQFKDQKVSSIDGIEKFKNLVSFIQTDLDLSGNLLHKSFQPLFALKYLKKLSLAENEIDTLSELPEQIENLDLSRNYLSSLGVLP